MHSTKSVVTFAQEVIEMTQAPILDTFLETEEFITAEEYLKRRERGEINPANVRIAPANLETGSFGGFIVKLDKPRYRTKLAPITKRFSDGF